MPPSFAIDIRTLFLTLVVMTVLLGILSIAFARQEPRTRALSSWGWGMLAVSAGLLVAAVPPTPRPALLNAAGNTAVVVGVVLLGRGVRLFRHVPTGDRLGWSLTGVVLLVSLLFPSDGSSFRVRTVAVTGILGLLALRTARELAGDGPSTLRPSQPFTALSLAAYAVALLVRTAGVLIEDRGARLMQPSLFDGLMFLLMAVAVLSANLGLMWMEMQRLERQLIDAATHDHLTGVLNRAALRAAFEREASRAHRSGRPFAVAIFDVDGFKGVNDRHGHPAGDEVLRAVVTRLQGTIRKHDVLGRFGGDEFALLLPDSDGAAAVTTCERARTAVEEAGFPCGGAVECLTVSAGLAVYGEHGLDWESLLAGADRALYAAKAGGRNRVVQAPSSGLGGTPTRDSVTAR
jgi:diguanylate cyclase (GGDEF)-like protein